MDSSLAKIKTTHEKMTAIQERMIAKMGAWREQTKACLEKRGPT
jgi:hypothetical protein